MELASFEINMSTDADYIKTRKKSLILLLNILENKFDKTKKNYLDEILKALNLKRIEKEIGKIKLTKHLNSHVNSY